MVRISARRDGEEGTGMVEFALVASVLFMLIFGIMDAGRALFAYDAVAQAARLGSRFAMVRGNSCSGLSGGCPASSNDIQTYLRSVEPGLNSSSLTATAVCSGGGTLVAPCDVGVNVTVRVAYSFSFVTPFTPLSWTMHSSSQVVVVQ
jgi:Flp pilus assembly protein TadG